MIFWVGWVSGQDRHRLPGAFIEISPSLCKIKKSSFPLGEQGQKCTISAVPPCLPAEPAASWKRHHASCPLTLAMRRKILRKSRSLRPRRPICCSAFRSALSTAVLSVDALAALLPRLWFGYDTPIKHHERPFVKNFFSPGADKNGGTGRRRSPPADGGRKNEGPDGPSAVCRKSYFMSGRGRQMLPISPLPFGHYSPGERVARRSRDAAPAGAFRSATARRAALSTEMVWDGVHKKLAGGLILRNTSNPSARIPHPLRYAQHLPPGGRHGCCRASAYAGFFDSLTRGRMAPRVNIL